MTATAATHAGRPRRKKRVALGRTAFRTVVTSPNWVTSLVLVLVLVLVLARIPPVRTFLNDQLINLVASSAKARPLPYSLWGPSACPPAEPGGAPPASPISSAAATAFRCS